MGGHLSRSPIFSFHWTFSEVLSGLGDHNFIQKRTFVVQIFGLIPCKEQLVDRKRRFIHTLVPFCTRNYSPKVNSSVCSIGVGGHSFPVVTHKSLFKLSDIAFCSRKRKLYSAKRLDKEHTKDLPSQNMRKIFCEIESSFSAKKRTQFTLNNLINYRSLSFIPSGKNPRDWRDQRFRRRIFPLKVCFLISFIRVWRDNFSLELYLILNQFNR